MIIDLTMDDDEDMPVPVMVAKPTPGGVSSGDVKAQATSASSSSSSSASLPLAVPARAVPTGLMHQRCDCEKFLFSSLAIPHSTACDQVSFDTLLCLLHVRKTSYSPIQPPQLLMTSSVSATFVTFPGSNARIGARIAMQISEARIRQCGRRSARRSREAGRQQQQ